LLDQVGIHRDEMGSYWTPVCGEVLEAM